jgi:hypothetical protein
MGKTHGRLLQAEAADDRNLVWFPQIDGKYALSVCDISRCHNNTGCSNWCVDTPTAPHQLLFWNIVREGGNVSPCKKEKQENGRWTRGVSMRDGATEEILALRFFIVVYGALVDDFGKVKSNYLQGIYVVSNSYDKFCFYLKHLCKSM